MEEHMTGQARSAKVQDIRDACHASDVDQLRQLAISEDGLVDDESRRTAWPILLGCAARSDDTFSDIKGQPHHRDEDQVQLDVNRSFVYYPEGESESKRDGRKEELSQVILSVLRRHPMLHYFQGYHDIVQVFLLVLGSDAAPSAVASLSLLRIRDFMLPSMAGTEPHLRLLPTILHAADPTLASHLSQTQPFFALPATLTLYAHEIEEYGSIARLFDFLLASEAVVSVYLFASVVISRKADLLEIEAEEPEMLHSVLSKLPRPLNLESLISDAVTLYHRYPPERLPGWAWARVSNNSVLKTSRPFEKLYEQTLQDGERHFEKQANELRRQEMIQRQMKRYRALARQYRRPVTYTGIAVFVAVVAMLARGQPLDYTVSALGTAFLGLQRKAIELWQHLTS